MSFNSDMTNLANAIRTKAGVTGGLTVSAMTTAVNGIVINTGSDIDFTGVNVTADQLLFGAVAINADGEKVEGNIGTVRIVQEADKIVVPPGYYPEGDSFPLPDTSELTATAGSLLSGLTAIGRNGEYITGNIQAVSPYISGSQVIVPEGYHGRQMYFDLNNGTGSGTFDLAKVTEYTPYAPALSAVSQIVVSGFGDDYSGANGTYNVTAETQAETDIWKRIYKHTSGEWFIWGDYDEDMEEGYWYIGVAPDSGDMVTWTTEELSDGEYGFENWDTGDYYDVTLDVTKTDYPERPLVLKGVKATGYTDGEWSFADSEQNFTGFETTPQKSYVYAVSGNKLIGSAVDLAGMYPGDAILSNCDSLTDTYMRYTNCELSTSVKKFGTGSIKINSNGCIKFNHGKTSLVNIPWTAAHFFYADSYTGGTDRKPLINNDTDAAGTFFIAITSDGKIMTHMRGGSYSETQDTLSPGWHHIRAVQYGGTLKAYLDGNLIATVATFSKNTDSLWIGKLAAASSRQFEGYIDGIEFFEIPANRLDLYTGDTAPVPDKEFEV